MTRMTSGLAVTLFVAWPRVIRRPNHPRMFMDLRSLILLGLVIAACGKSTPPAPSDKAREPGTPATAAPQESPAAISHGEAAIGAALTAPDRAADAPPP